MEWNWDKFYDRASDWMITHLPKIGAALVVLFIGLWISRIFSRWLTRILEKRKFHASLRYFLLNLIVITVQILIIFLALQIAGIQLTFFTAIVAGLSVAAGLALSGTLQNFVAGILILLLRPYRVGDNVIIQGQEGAVTSIQLFYTIILTFDNKTIIVPNGQLSNNITVNLSRKGSRRLDVELRLPYKTEFGAVKQLIEEMIRKDKTMLEDPSPRIGITKLDGDRYVVAVQVWTAAHGFEDTKLLLQEQLLREFQSKNWFA